MKQKIMVALFLCLVPSCATEPETATIAFQLDAPLCGSMRIERAIDNMVVGSDILANGVKTQPIEVTATAHVVSAKVLYYDGRPGVVYTFPDTTYTLTRGDNVTRMLPLYCS
jgi:hypothetical protein